MAEIRIDRVLPAGDWLVERYDWPDDMGHEEWLRLCEFDPDGALVFGEGSGAQITCYPGPTGRWLIEVESGAGPAMYVIASTTHQALDLAARWAPLVTAEVLAQISQEKR